MSKLKLLRPATYEILKEGQMLVPGLLIANEGLILDPSIEEPIQQVRNVACLKGIVGHSIAMPDIHWGYGFPIGGVAAMDAETGVISPGGVGYDINCGVRLAIAPIEYKKLSTSTKQSLLESIFKNIPSGTGRSHSNSNKALTETDYQKIASLGARWSIEMGYGFQSDLDHMESLGLIDGANLQYVSENAKKRGELQLGTIGSGNHFVEIGEVSQIYLEKIAHRWKVEQGLTYILIHTGSRGFGHQICQDFLNQFVKLGYAEGLPDKQLVCAPIGSPEGQAYFAAMATAANFAFNNRQRVLHAVRQSFKETCAIEPESIHLVYDVCHNIAKMENHMVEGHIRKLCVHRKGATRAFGPQHEELAPIYKQTGQPVLVPGDMGRASHLMVGQGNPITWCSACHGAGRAKSRVKAKDYWEGKNATQYMQQLGVQVKAHSYKTIAEEMPDAYKDVDVVVEAVEEAGLAKKVAKLKPSLVIKG